MRVAWGLVALAGACAVVFLRRPPVTVEPPRAPASELFAENYPVLERFQDELNLLRQKGRLKEKNETLIAESVRKASGAIGMPPAVLWCLLFQESRLNHLQGWPKATGARGIGQFSPLGFYEINHHLDRFGGRNLAMFRETVGRDVRPLIADEKWLLNPRSYFYIPTGVAASAAYLNNRYHHLGQILDRRGYRYHPDLLWLYAAMAYNKGTRSVLSFWNVSLRRGGRQRLEAVLNDHETFRKSTSNPRLVFRTLKRIWPEDTAESYAQELRIHLENMWECSVAQVAVASQGRQP